MQTIRLMRVGAALALAAGFILIIVDDSSIGKILSLLLVSISLFLFLYAERKLNTLRITEVSEHKDRFVMKTLSHYRHDWMNDLQVLFGYIRLKKYDKLHPYLEKIKSKLSEESDISNLGNTALSLLLLSYRMNSQHYELIVTMDKSVKLNEIPVRPDLILQYVRETLQIFQQSAEPSPAEHNELEFSLVTTDELISLIYQFTGQYKADKLELSLRKWSSKVQANGNVQCEYHLEDGQADLWVNIRY